MFRTQDNDPDIVDILDQYTRREFLKAAFVISAVDGQIAPPQRQKLQHMAESLQLSDSIYRRLRDGEFRIEEPLAPHRRIQRTEGDEWCRYITSECIKIALVDEHYDARERSLLKSMADEAGMERGEFVEHESELLEPLQEGKKPAESYDDFQDRVTTTWARSSVAVSGIAPGSMASIALKKFSRSLFQSILDTIRDVLGDVLSFRWGDEKDNRPNKFEFVSVEQEGSYDIVPISGFLSEHSDHADDWKVLSPQFPNAHIEPLAWSAGEYSGWLPMSAALSGANLSIDDTPAAAVSVPKLLDEWDSACRQADLTGEKLARKMVSADSRPFPTTLIGFSLGCRVIYRTLCKMDEDEISREVENVVMMGGAVRGKRQEWERIVEHVPGYVVNIYCQDDAILKYLYQVVEWSGAPIGIDQLGQASQSPGLVDIDVTDDISSHPDYRNELQHILSKAHEQTTWL